jgi:nicotinate-nucleotide adenylyltransferase
LIGLFGGTFDPIHRGHLHAAEQVRRLLELSEVRLILSARPPHRSGPGATIEHRWQMLTRATRGRRGLRADDREIRRMGGAASFTVDTLTELRLERGPAQAMVWCLGWDAFLELTTWKDWRQLIELAHLAVFKRPGAAGRPSPELSSMITRHTVAQPGELGREAAGGLVILEADMLDISATEIRAKLARNEDTSGLLPAAVWSYIRQHQLYGGSPI